MTVYRSPSCGCCGAWIDHAQKHGFQIEDIKTNSQRELKATPDYSFKKCFDGLIVRWKKCIASEGAYFEGDIINLDD